MFLHDVLLVCLKLIWWLPYLERGVQPALIRLVQFPGVYFSNLMSWKGHGI